MTDSPRLTVVRRVTEVALPDPWAAFTVTAWVNADAGRRRRFMAPANDDELFAGARELILGHTLTDDAGALPEAGTEDFFRRLPAGSYPAIQKAVLGQYGQLTTKEQAGLEEYYRSRYYDRLRDQDGPPPERPRASKLPWLLVRERIAEEWRVAPWEVEAPELGDELGRKLQAMRLEAKYG